MGSDTLIYFLSFKHIFLYLNVSSDSLIDCLVVKLLLLSGTGPPSETSQIKRDSGPQSGQPVSPCTDTNKSVYRESQTSRSSFCIGRISKEYTILPSTWRYFLIALVRDVILSVLVLRSLRVSSCPKDCFRTDPNPSFLIPDNKIDFFLLPRNWPVSFSPPDLPDSSSCKVPLLPGVPRNFLQSGRPKPSLLPGTKPLEDRIVVPPDTD